MFMPYMRFMPRLVLPALAASIACVCVSGAYAVDYGLVEAYQKKNIKALQRYTATYRKTPIEPYIFAAGINVREAAQGALSPVVVQGLDRFAGIPPVEKLRAGLLKEWARKSDWKQFEDHISRIPAWLAEKDTELKCAQITFTSARQKPLEITRTELFAQMREFPPLCGEAFAGAFSTGEIPQDLALSKLAQLAAFGSRASGLRLLQVLDAEAGSDKTRKAAASAIVEILHAARDDFDDGKRELAAHGNALDATTLRLVTVHVGALGAKKLNHGAHALISSVDGYRLGMAGAAAEWRTRAALMTASWNDVRTSIESMPQQLHAEPVWQYWYAQALRKLGRTQEASQFFAALACKPGYYGLLAAEAAGIRPAYLASAPEPDPTLVRQFLGRTDVQRTKALHRAGLWVEAAHEWKVIMQGADSSTYYAAAHAAKDLGLVDRQIALAIGAVEHFDLALRYPRVHEREVLSASQSAGILPELTWAVIRQESRFVAHAVSSAGAVGLMQLMPATAKRVAAKKGMKAKPTRQVLCDPEPNIDLGAAFLGSLMRSYSGNVAYTAAAYNAGPGRVVKWRGLLPGTEIERFVELIPFDETRDYTKNVLANYVMYAYARGKQPVSLQELAQRKD